LAREAQAREPTFFELQKGEDVARNVDEEPLVLVEHEASLKIRILCTTSAAGNLSFRSFLAGLDIAEQSPPQDLPLEIFEVGSRSDPVLARSGLQTQKFKSRQLVVEVTVRGNAHTKEKGCAPVDRRKVPSLQNNEPRRGSSQDATQEVTETIGAQTAGLASSTDQWVNANRSSPYPVSA